MLKCHIQITVTKSSLIKPSRIIGHMYDQRGYLGRDIEFWGTWSLDLEVLAWSGENARIPDRCLHLHPGAEKVTNVAILQILTSASQ